MSISDKYKIELALTKVRARCKNRKSLVTFDPLPSQVAPPGDWFGWFYKGARGSGKTFRGANWIIDDLRRLGSASWCGVVAPNRLLCKRLCFEGPSGLYTLFRDEFVDYNKSELTLTHRSGGKVWGFGSEEPDRLEGPEFTRAWFEELTNWTYPKSFETAMLCVRRGADPRWIATFVPKMRDFVRKAESRKNEIGIVVTRGKTRENIHLHHVARTRFESMYGGTSMARVMLEGEDEVMTEGAMWKPEWIEESRVTPDKVPELVYTVIGVDPAATSSETSAETGLCYGGLGADGDIYIIESDGGKWSPLSWGTKVIEMYLRKSPQLILAEKNQGGEMVELTVRSAAREYNSHLVKNAGQHKKHNGTSFTARFIEPDSLPIELLPASKSKPERAAPAASMSERGRVHHVGYFSILEQQLTTFPVDTDLIDRLDAYVHVVRRLMEVQAERDARSGMENPGIASAILESFARQSPWQI